ncbi:sodium-dependent noradrenaline transporter-like [Dermacentor variabilis]|uniref:sodium-dependent noradrenaline transporter-like n=1 Tax=Dermacentor variabilis TaxID=34621 RepID=UPI003F5CB301
MTFLLAMPLCQIEIALAQFSGSSIKALWKCMPLGRGIGVAGCFCAALVSVYQALVVAYAATYLGDSVLYPELPWTACGPAWGADAACYGLADAQARGRGTEFVHQRLNSACIYTARRGRPPIRHECIPTLATSA